MGRGDAPATLTSPLPQPTTGHHNLGTCSGPAQPSGRLAQIGDKEKWLQGQPHGQLRAAKKPQQEYGKGAAGMLQQHIGWVKRLQEWPQVRQERVQVAVEPQEMWAVAQPPEAKVSEVANPLPWAAEPQQPQVGSLAQLPPDAPAWRMPPNLPAGHVLIA